MGYMKINNLYKDQTILLFKECYAMEKIHGTSAHIKWDGNQVKIFSGGEDHLRFSKLFDLVKLKSDFSNKFPHKKEDGVTTFDTAVIYGEAYGGKQQRMSETYGKELKFVAFDVKINNMFLMTSIADHFCRDFGIEFVDYAQIPCTLEAINAERDKSSVQAVRNGIKEPKMREGVVLRPVIALVRNNGSRIQAKHKNDAFMETSTKREVNEKDFVLLTEAKAIADEWVTPMRLTHVLDKFPDYDITDTGNVIKAMIADVEAEAEGEIMKSKVANRAIGAKTALMYKELLKSVLVEKNEKGR